MSGPRPPGGVAPQRHPGHQLAATSSPLTSSVSSPSITSSLALASDSVLMQRRTTAHTPCCSASTMPTRRITEGRSGKMPTTSVRLRISLLRRSWRLVDQIWLHHHGGHGNLRQTLHLRWRPGRRLCRWPEARTKNASPACVERTVSAAAIGG